MTRGEKRTLEASLQFESFLPLVSSSVVYRAATYNASAQEIAHIIEHDPPRYGQIHFQCRDEANHD